MARAKPRSAHIGGQQLPLIVPDSDWRPPAELPDLRGLRTPLALDVENKDEGLAAGRGSGWPMRAGHICGLAAAWEGGSFYAPTRHPETENLPEENVRRWVADHVAAGVRIVTHHGSHDWGWMGTDWGVRPPDGSQLEDTEALAAVVDENQFSYELNALCRWRGVPGKDEVALREAAAAYGWHGSDVKGNMWRMPGRYVGPYGEQDAVSTLELYNSLAPELDAQELTPAYRLEMDIVPLVLEMRRRGVRVNLDKAVETRDALRVRRDAALADLSERLGLTGLRIEDIRQLSNLERWHDAHKIVYQRTAKTDRGSFHGGVKGWMTKHPHWLPRLISKADQLEDMASKFCQTFILDYSHRGRLHASINQFRGEEGGTRSHRFSYSDPPLQQMPERVEEWAALIRDQFEPEEGQVWGSFDYSQQEYRLIVHFAVLLGCTGADVAAEKYRQDPKTDFHVYVSEITGLERRPAKDTNFAKSFGAGIPKFAAMINKSVEEAGDIYRQYDRELPFVKQLSQACQSAADRRGFIRLLDGARRHFDLWELSWREPGEEYKSPRPLALARETWEGRKIRRAYTHKAMSALIQGSAARQTKEAMRECGRLGHVPLLQMHDELGFSLTSLKMGREVLVAMRDVRQLEVPMLVDGELGPSWGRAKTKLEDYRWKMRLKKNFKAHLT